MLTNHEMLLTILSSLAQQESESMSGNIKMKLNEFYIEFKSINFICTKAP